MKRNLIIACSAAFALLAAIGCSDVKREPGKIYMPDMAYSRAVETYAPLDSSVFTTDKAKIGEAIYYDATPVTGSMQRGALPPYTLANDSAGYANSKNVPNPLTAPLTGKDSSETARLWNINCGICHGADGKATGPLATSAKVGGIANLALQNYIDMADGTMYHSIHYGKNNMGSYASQLSSKQRWQLVQYIRLLQPKPEKATTAAPAPAKDSAMAKK